jgi:hypothetical protein
VGGTFRGWHLPRSGTFRVPFRVPINRRCGPAESNGQQHFRTGTAKEFAHAVLEIGFFGKHTT